MGVISRISALLLCVVASTTGPATATNVTGAGSTFVYPVLAKWAAEYKKITGHEINYQSIGSGAGITQIKAGTVDFGASDKPLSPQELAAFGAGQFPLVIGGVVPVVNIKGVAPGQLRFSGELLAKIYLGQVKRWSDPLITAENPGVTLPDAPIAVIHRADGSGTTFNFTNFLSKVSPEWKSTVGEGTAVSWPTGLGGKGNEGVSAFVQRIDNSIGYVEYAYAVGNKMAYALVKNRAGNYVAPNAQSFQAAGANADWKNSQDFFLVMTDAPGANAYPITATVFIIMYKTPADATKSKVAFDFFAWVFANGQKEAEALDYVPLPASLVSQIMGYWKKEFKQ